MPESMAPQTIQQTVSSLPDFAIDADGNPVILETPERRREKAEKSFYEFVKQAWEHIESAPFIDGWHVRLICDHLQAVTEGCVENLLINVPPGHSKSSLTSVLWPVWEWIRKPSVRFFFASYDQRLSTRDSVRCRALLLSSWYQESWGDRFQLTNDQNQKTYFENTAGGYRIATSPTGHGMGQHPDRVVVDDPIDPHGAESEAERQGVIDWWDMTMSTRGVSRGVRAVGIMQRLAVDDFSGHVLKYGGFLHVCLPFRFEYNRMAPSPVLDPDGVPWQDKRTIEGELLAPGQFSEKAAKNMERRLGAYGIAGQLQQRPVPKGGALFKRKWWDGRARYRLENGDAIIRLGKPGVVVLNQCAVFVIVDGAASSKDTADHTVVSVFAVSGQGELFVLWVVRDRFEVEDVVPVVQDVCLAWRPDWVGIEANGFQIWFVKAARDKIQFPGIPTVRELNPEGKGKAHRAASAIIKAEQGEIYLPYLDDVNSPWVGGFEEELYAFTGKEGRPDDQTDTVAYAVLAIDKFGYGSTDQLPERVATRRPGPFS